MRVLMSCRSGCWCPAWSSVSERDKHLRRQRGDGAGAVPRGSHVQPRVLPELPGLVEGLQGKTFAKHVSPTAVVQCAIIYVPGYFLSAPRSSHDNKPQNELLV